MLLSIYHFTHFSDEPFPQLVVLPFLVHCLHLLAVKFSLVTLPSSFPFPKTYFISRGLVHWGRSECFKPLEAQYDCLKSTIQYNTIQYNTIQYNTIQYNTLKYNTKIQLKYNTIQHNINAILI